MIFIIVFVPCT